MNNSKENKNIKDKEKEKEKENKNSSNSKSKNKIKNKSVSNCKNKVGRKPLSDYWVSDDGLILLNGWARDGLTDEQIANNIGVSIKTLYEWKRKFSSLSESLKKGKEIADYIVENSLYKTANGFYYKEEALTKNGDKVIVEKYAFPNITAQIFWLKNRKPKQWREKIDALIEKCNEVNRVKIVNDTTPRDEKLLDDKKKGELKKDG